MNNPSEAVREAYEEWCRPRMSSVEPDHPADAFAAGYAAATAALAAEVEGLRDKNALLVQQVEASDRFVAEAGEKYRQAEAKVAACEADARRLDWIPLQSDDFSFSLIQDGPGDGEWLVFGMEGSGQAKTFRAALDAAMQEKPHE